MTIETTSIANGYIRATNCHDAAAFHALFAENAIVDDAGRTFSGLEAIKDWSNREIFAAQVTLDVLDFIDSDGDALITTRVDGNFDRTGLPDPLIITHRVKAESDKIIGLTCRLEGT